MSAPLSIPSPLFLTVDVYGLLSVDSVAPSTAFGDEGVRGRSLGLSTTPLTLLASLASLARVAVVFAPSRVPFWRLPASGWVTAE